MAAKVYIILINLNQEDHTRECILSLQKVSYKPTEIILIDNDSTDGSGERLHADFPDVIYHKTKENIGFAGGNNVGIKIAIEGGADFIMLLNNDTIVDKDFMQPLIGLAKADNTIGFQSCKIYFYSQPKNFWYAGGILKVNSGYCIHRGIMEEDRGQYDKVEETELATGCMMFATREVIERVGLLDDNLFIYYEDADWCMRARKLGLRNMYNPNAIIWHKVSVTNKIDSPFFLYFTMRNKIIFIRKHSRPLKWLLYLPYLFFYYGRQIVRMSLKWRSYTGTKAIIFAIIDGCRYYTGEYGKGRWLKL